MQSKNEQVLQSFVKFCQEHPEYRFWQALRNWCGYHYILATNAATWSYMDGLEARDTFYWEGAVSPQPNFQPKNIGTER